ncbi:MAG: nucleotidyl transferase AbiEii/AbiGii toxin family protein [Petrimonas sp.]|nr:nucleotidyl transferase AbiEii/AbiGii toxin family protein [Petrimonas sp.]
MKELLHTLSIYFQEKELKFYVIGATARDILIRYFSSSQSLRRTRDLDVAIAIPDWDRFEEIAREISSMPDFVKSRHQKQRFIYKDVYELDIVPFGKVAKEDGYIYWPPDEEIGMSVKGFSYVLKDAVTFGIDNEFEINVASLPALFILKFEAWIDRNISTSKDAEDIFNLVSNYYDAFEERNMNTNYHQEVYEMDDFDTFVAGAIWLGHDLCTILSIQLIEHYQTILSEELSDAEESRLIHQMMVGSSISYIRIYRALASLSAVWQNYLSVQQ